MNPPKKGKGILLYTSVLGEGSRNKDFDGGKLMDLQGKLRVKTIGINTYVRK